MPHYLSVSADYVAWRVDKTCWDFWFEKEPYPFVEPSHHGLPESQTFKDLIARERSTVFSGATRAPAHTAQLVQPVQPPATALMPPSYQVLPTQQNTSQQHGFTVSQYQNPGAYLQANQAHGQGQQGPLFSQPTQFGQTQQVPLYSQSIEVGQVHQAPVYSRTLQTTHGQQAPVFSLPAQTGQSQQVPVSSQPMQAGQVRYTLQQKISKALMEDYLGLKEVLNRCSYFEVPVPPMVDFNKCVIQSLDKFQHYFGPLVHLVYRPLYTNSKGRDVGRKLIVSYMSEKVKADDPKAIDTIHFAWHVIRLWYLENLTRSEKINGDGAKINHVSLADILSQLRYERRAHLNSREDNWDKNSAIKQKRITPKDAKIITRLLLAKMRVAQLSQRTNAGQTTRKFEKPRRLRIPRSEDDEYQRPQNVF